MGELKQDLIERQIVQKFHQKIGKFFLSIIIYGVDYWLFFSIIFKKENFLTLFHVSGFMDRGLYLLALTGGGLS